MSDDDDSGDDDDNNKSEVAREGDELVSHKSFSIFILLPLKLVNNTFDERRDSRRENVVKKIFPSTPTNCTFCNPSLWGLNYDPSMNIPATNLK